jgi:hypothetical protein
MHVFLIILTDNAGQVAVEVFDTFDHAKDHILNGIMSDSSYNRQRKQVQQWDEVSLPKQVSDDDGDIMLRKELVRS